MKRLSNLFDGIIDFQNLRLAWLKAAKGKRKKSEVVLFSRNVPENLEEIRARLLSLDPGWGQYHRFVVTDPKERFIHATPFSVRVMHHAIMNVLEPILERHLVYHSHACRKGKGMHAAVLYAFRKTKRHGYFLKLDVRKYFDSIDHTVLKKQLERLIKDQRVLHLLRGIIDRFQVEPQKGLPIGNLTSQFFANQYLSTLDHHILETWKIPAYVRYMDDFVLWHDHKEVLQTVFHEVREFARNRLCLELKPPVLDSTHRGVPFLGFHVKPSGIFLLRKSKRRMQRRAEEINAGLQNGDISPEQAARRAISVNAAVLISRSRAFRAKIWQESDHGLEPGVTGRQLEQ